MSHKQRPDVSTERERPEQFTKIPDAVIEAKWMTSSLLYVYCAVAKHRSYAAPDEPVFPSQARIAKITKLGERQVRRLLKVLEERGVFTRTPGGKGRSTRYRFQSDERTWVSGQEEGPRTKADMDVRSKEDMGVRSRADMDVPLTRAIVTRTKNERGKPARKCYHGLNACCDNCLTPTVVSKPVSQALPKPRSHEEEDF